MFLVVACGVRPAATSLAPEIKTVYASIEGAFALDVDLNQSDQTRVLPVAHTATFKVLAKDEALDSLSVAVVDESGAAIAGQSVTLRNGLFQVVVMVAPAMTLRVRATDVEGLESEFAYRLILPSREETVVGSWETRFFGTDKALTTSYTATFAADGQWSETRGAASVQGSYVIEGDRLRNSRAQRAGPRGRLLRRRHLSLRQPVHASLDHDRPW